VHPLGKSDPERAQREFVQLAYAYEVLSDPNLRAVYEMERARWVSGHSRRLTPTPR
jgi:DnaJ-class molecular chaperone